MQKKIQVHHRGQLEHPPEINGFEQLIAGKSGYFVERWFEVFCVPPREIRGVLYRLGTGVGGEVECACGYGIHESHFCCRDMPGQIQGASADVIWPVIAFIYRYRIEDTLCDPVLILQCGNVGTVKQKAGLFGLELWHRFRIAQEFAGGKSGRRCCEVISARRMAETSLAPRLAFIFEARRKRVFFGLTSDLVAQPIAVVWIEHFELLYGSVVKCGFGNRL